MNATQLVEVELARQNWAALRDIAGTAEGIPSALRQLVSAKSAADVQTAYWGLENRVVVQGQLFESSVAVTHVLMAALVSPERPSFVRIGILELLLQIVMGEAAESEKARGLPNLGEECRRAARTGLWLLYREMLEGQMEGAREVIAFLEQEPERLRAVERWIRDD